MTATLIALLVLVTLTVATVQARTGPGGITPTTKQLRHGLKVERQATNRVLERRCRPGRHWPQVRSVWAIPRRHVEAVLQRELRRQRYARTLSSRCAAPRAVGKYLAARLYGWYAWEWTALNFLWTHESGWNPTAHNPTSGACGIPQFVPCSVPLGRSERIVRLQVRRGLSYIAGRYGAPSGAWAHFQAVRWY